MVKVGINGFGTIGRRVAQAVMLQPDMELVGVVKTRPDYAAMQAARTGIRLYAPTNESIEAFEAAGIRVEGVVEDLLSRVDVIVDATPNGVGEKYKPLYLDAGVKQVFQGGEKPSVANASFNTLCNYKEVLGVDSVRVVSCNTTGLLRLICTINKEIGISSGNIDKLNIGDSIDLSRVFDLDGENVKQCSALNSNLVRLCMYM